MILLLNVSTSLSYIASYFNLDVSSLSHISSFIVESTLKTSNQSDELKYSLRMMESERDPVILVIKIDTADSKRGKGELNFLFQSLIN